MSLFKGRRKHEPFEVLHSDGTIRLFNRSKYSKVVTVNSTAFTVAAGATVDTEISSSSSATIIIPFHNSQNMMYIENKGGGDIDFIVEGEKFFLGTGASDFDPYHTFSTVTFVTTSEFYLHVYGYGG